MGGRCRRVVESLGHSSKMFQFENWNISIRSHNEALSRVSAFISSQQTSIASIFFFSKMGMSNLPNDLHPILCPCLQCKSITLGRSKFYTSPREHLLWNGKELPVYLKLEVETGRYYVIP